MIYLTSSYFSNQEKPVKFFLEVTKAQSDIIIKLLTKIANKGVKSHPALSENQWREILKDLLLLVDTVFTFVKRDKLYGIYLQSLLRAGSILNSNLTTRLCTIGCFFLTHNRIQVGSGVFGPRRECRTHCSRSCGRVFQLLHGSISGRDELRRGLVRLLQR